MKKLRLFRSSRVISFFLLLSTATALAVAGQLLYESSGVSSFRLFQSSDGMRTVTKVSQNYDLYRKYTEIGGEELFLVASSKSVNEYLDGEGVSGTLSWSVRKGPRLENLVWGRTEQATELNVHGNQPVLVSGLGGCCAEMTGYRLFDIENGRLLMSFNDFFWRDKVTQPFSLEVPNSSLRIRYVGVISQDSTRDRDFVTPEVGKSAVLLLKYANESLKQKVQLDMEVESGYAASVLEVKMEKDPSVPGSDQIEILDDQVRLWNVDGATTPGEIRGVLLKIVVDGGKGTKVIKIPINGDQFDLSQAQIPAGVSVQPIVQLRTF